MPLGFDVVYYVATANLNKGVSFDFSLFISKACHLVKESKGLTWG